MSDLPASLFIFVLFSFFIVLIVNRFLGFKSEIFLALETSEQFFQSSHMLLKSRVSLKLMGNFLMSRFMKGNKHISGQVTSGHRRHNKVKSTGGKCSEMHLDAFINKGHWW